MKNKNTNQSLRVRIAKDIRKYYGAYLLVLPVVIYYLLFHYKPMYGIIIAFKNYRPRLGIWGSAWADNFGMQNFIDFCSSYYFWRLIKNTLTISLTCLVVNFPVPILFALLLNEIKNEKFKKVTQTISYMPHFVSIVVVCSMIKLFTGPNGFITNFLTLFGAEKGIALLTKKEYFVPIYSLSGLWEQMGWNTIIYLAAIAGVDPSLYEAAEMDGAGRWKKMWHVTLPAIAGTIVIMLLLRLGSVMSVGMEKVLLLYNKGIYETADVISTFVYRKGLETYEYSYSTAVDLFNSVINFLIVAVFNKLSKKYTEMGLW